MMASDGDKCLECDHTRVEHRKGNGRRDNSRGGCTKCNCDEFDGSSDDEAKATTMDDDTRRRRARFLVIKAGSKDNVCAECHHKKNEHANGDEEGGGRCQKRGCSCQAYLDPDDDAGGDARCKCGHGIGRHKGTLWDPGKCTECDCKKYEDPDYEDRKIMRRKDRDDDDDDENAKYCAECGRELSSAERRNEQGYCNACQDMHSECADCEHEGSQHEPPSGDGRRGKCTECDCKKYKRN